MAVSDFSFSQPNTSNREELEQANKSPHHQRPCVDLNAARHRGRHYQRSTTVASCVDRSIPRNQNPRYRYMLLRPRGSDALAARHSQHKRVEDMSRETENKAIVGRWFEGFWGNPWKPKIIDELAAPDMLLQYSMHAPRRGREDIR